MSDKAPVCGVFSYPPTALDTALLRDRHVCFRLLEDDADNSARVTALKLPSTTLPIAAVFLTLLG